MIQVNANFSPVGFDAIDIDDPAGWMQLDLSSVTGNIAALLVTPTWGVGSAENILFAFSDTIPGNDKTANIPYGETLLLQNYNQIQTLWIRNIGPITQVGYIMYQ